MFKSVGVFTVLAVALWATPVSIAQSPSELLEKAIYAEETVGDLDQAIEIYRQVVTDTKAAEAAAAQAQFRLGQCLLKQKKTDEATAAFKKVIQDYPNQAEWVARAQQQVPELAPLQLGPEPWEDGEFLQLTVKLAGGLNIGSFIWSVDSAQVDERDVWRMKTFRFITAGGDNRGISEVDADKQTFQPIRSSFRHTLMGTTDATYTKDQVSVIRPGSNGEPRSESLNRVFYDNEQGVFVFRRLPLAEGYKASVPIYATFGGGAVDIQVEVNGKETVTVPAGSFECYKVTLRPVNQVFWHTTDAHRYLVKFDAGGVTAELQRVGQNKPGETRPYRDDAFGFSLEVPSGWYYLEDSTPADQPTRMVTLVTPDLTATPFVGVWKIDAIKIDDAKKSARAWAEYRLKDAGQAVKEMKVREDSWQELTVAGFPAVRVVVDYMAGQNKQVGQGVFVLGNQTAAELTFRACAPEQLDAQRAAFQPIIDSFQTK